MQQLCCLTTDNILLVDCNVLTFVANCTVVPYLYHTSIGASADDLVINPVEGCYYFLPVQHLSSQPHNTVVKFSSLVTCPQCLHSCCWKRTHDALMGLIFITKMKLYVCCNAHYTLCYALSVPMDTTDYFTTSNFVLCPPSSSSCISFLLYIPQCFSSHILSTCTLVFLQLCGLVVMSSVVLVWWQYCHFFSVCVWASCINISFNCCITGSWLVFP